MAGFARVAVLVIAGLFALLGIYDPDWLSQHAVQAIALACSAVGGVVYWWLRKFGETKLLADFTDRFEAHSTAPGWAIGVLLVALGFAAFALAAPAAKQQHAAWQLAGYLGFAAAVCAGSWLAMRRKGKATLVLDSIGIDHYSTGLVPWNEVRGMSLERVSAGRQSFAWLCLWVKDPLRFRSPTARALRSRLGLDELWKPMAGEMLAIPLDLLDQPAALILEIATRLRHRVSPPMLPGWTPRLSDPAIEALEAVEATTLQAKRIVIEEQQGVITHQAAATRMSGVVQLLKRQRAVAAEEKSKGRLTGTILVLVAMALLLAARLYLGRHAG